MGHPRHGLVTEHPDVALLCKGSSGWCDTILVCNGHDTAKQIGIVCEGFHARPGWPFPCSIHLVCLGILLCYNMWSEAELIIGALGRTRPAMRGPVAAVRSFPGLLQQAGCTAPRPLTPSFIGSLPAEQKGQNIAMEIIRNALRIREIIHNICHLRSALRKPAY